MAADQNNTHTESRISWILFQESYNSSIIKDWEALISTGFIVFVVFRGINNFAGNGGASICFQVGNRAMNFVTPGAQILAIEVTFGVNVRCTHELWEYYSSGRINHKDGWHELVTSYGAFVVDN